MKKTSPIHDDLSNAQRLLALLEQGGAARRGIPLALLADVAYRNYAVEVVTNRAIPDVRDGLKPVHRRILYDMVIELGLTNRQPHKKSARIVGDVLGKFHPHGDKSVYDAMVILAQDFSMRLPLVDGQGNFGSQDGDEAAAMRYTEARPSAAGMALLADINANTVDFTDNFDGTLQEPTVLPTQLPNLLINGSDGIAVGMATRIPPHNVGEVCEAVLYVVKNWERRDKITTDKLMDIIPGPDYPTGGMVYRYRVDAKSGEKMDMLRQAYDTGRSTLVVSALADIQEIGGGKSEITITELPYQIARSTIKDRVADDRDKFREAGVSNVSDLSDRKGMRLVFETVRGFDPSAVLAYLMTNTKLTNSHAYSAVVLVPNDKGELEPRQLGLRDILMEFIRFRLQVITRRTQYELDRAEKRLHIVRALLAASLDIDEVIRIIRNAADEDAARTGLMKRLKVEVKRGKTKTLEPLDEAQAQAILDMPLKRINKLDTKKLQDERGQLEAKIDDLRDILGNEARRLSIVADETKQARDQFATPRRTRIISAEEGHKVVVTGPAAVEETQVILVGPDGVRCVAESQYKDKVPTGKASGRAVEVITQRLTANPEATVLLFTNKGRAWKGSVHRLAAGISLEGNERVVSAGVADPTKLVVLGTRAGNIKRVKVEDALNRAEGVWGGIIGLEDDKDEVLMAAIASESAQVLFFTAGSLGESGEDGRVLRFEARQVNPQATPSAKGVAGIKAPQTLIGGAVFEPGEHTEARLVVLSQAGFIKQVPLSDFPVQGRAGLGVMALKLGTLTGPVAACALARPGDQLDIYSAKGKRLRLDLKDVETSNRVKPGQNLAKAYGEEGTLFGGDAPARVVAVR